MKKEKFYLGISLGFNSSAAIIGTESGVLCAVSEERLNRQKNTKELPFDAMKACVEMAKKRAETSKVSVDEIVYSHYEGISHTYLAKNCPKSLNKLYSKLSSETAENAFRKMIIDYLGLPEDTKITRVEHHTAHEYSCYPIYAAFDKNVNSWLTMTADGFGDGYSGRIKYYSNGSEKVLSQVRVVDSPALIYQFFTGALGFKEHQHEGKVTGLAAHCEAHPDKAEEVYHELCQLLMGTNNVKVTRPNPVEEIVDGNKYTYNDSGFWLSEANLEPLTSEQIEMAKNTTIVDFKRFLRLKNTVYKFVQSKLGSHYDKDNILAWLNGDMPLPEDMKYTPWELAYAVQLFAEKTIMSWLNTIPKEYRGLPIYCAGGLVANVKLNQRIKDSGLFSKVYVSAPMGDEGTALGCALYKMNSDGYELKGRIGPEIIINGGTDINFKEELSKIVKEASKIDKLMVVEYKYRNDLIDKVTDLLAKNEIVHWCQQAEEFGPRALMNHSTLYTAQDPNGTHTLNQAMGRSEYMPYCPVCKNTSADELFDNWEVGEESCRFMAMTMNCKPGVKEKYRGGVHVDNTARAQFVYENDPFTKDAWKLLDSYEEKTGNKMMINTSFNIHNTPTCNLAGDCWEAWKQSNFVGAALALGNYLFINTEKLD